MLETYLGLIPGEAPIDRLVEGVVEDPIVAAPGADTADLIVGDPLTGAIVGIVPGDRRRAADLRAGDLADGSGLWRRLRTRWTSARGAAEASHV
jgi:hypothetical protein